MKHALSVHIGELDLQNPVMVASGTFGYAQEFKDFIELKKLGAIVTKTITMKPREGNPSPRTCETAAGMLNSIGLENPGIEAFIEEKLPFLKKIGVPLIVSIASEGGPDEFVTLAGILDRVKGVDAIELNISCPNIRVHPRTRTLNLAGSRAAGSRESVVHSKRKKNYGLRTTDYGLISQDPRATYEVVKRVRKVTKKTLITKLSPNVTSICDIAIASERAGSDAVALINTLSAMSVDVQTREPKIATVTAGLSGPAIRPIAIRMVWEVFQKIKIPVIGMGGIIDTASALEFFIAGATAVSVGTANFINPKATVEIIEGLRRYVAKNHNRDIASIIGSLKI